MNILIFGATGGTGKQLVAQSLAKGYTVTAFVRNPAKLKTTDVNLKVTVGDVFDVDSVKKAMTGQDAVVCLLGNNPYKVFFRPSYVITPAVKNIVSAMQTCKVSRLLLVSSFAVGKNIFVFEKLSLNTIFRNLFADKPAQEEMVKQSGLDWTLVRPALLINGRHKGVYNSSEELKIGPFSRISRADVADFIVKNIENSDQIHKTTTISY